MKITKCKRCDIEGVFWTQNANGKWQLLDSKSGAPHFCDDGKLKAVKCKYCNADDLHWAEDVNPLTHEKKMVLMESYGLQHACDERINFLAKEKQAKKDRYEAEKKRVNAHPDGVCTTCKGTGYTNGSQPGARAICEGCHGYTNFTERTRKGMLSAVRQKIWPNMPAFYGRGRRY
jgi:hypothetical protein